MGGTHEHPPRDMLPLEGHSALQPDLVPALTLEPNLFTLWFYLPFTIALKVPPRGNQGAEGNPDPSP